MNDISMSLRQPGRTFGHLPRRSGLTETDIIRAERALGTLGGGWTLDRHEDYDRVVSLVIAAADDDDAAPSFALHVEAGSIVTGMLLHDDFHALGRHDRIEDSMRTIAAVLRGGRPIAA